MWHPCNLAAKDSGLECTCVNNADFTVLVSGHSRRHWVSTCTVWPSQSKCLSREMSLHQILHKAWTFLHRNYLDDSEGHSYGQLVIGSFITTMCLLMGHVSCSFSVKHQITQVTQPHTPHSSPDLAACNFWLFPKLQSPLKGKRFQTVDEIQEYKTG